MTDDRVNIKVPPAVHAELDADRDMSWPDYLLHLKRTAERDTGDNVVGDELGQLRDSVATVEERTNRIERTLEELTR